MTHEIPKFLEQFTHAMPPEAIKDFQERVPLVQKSAGKNLLSFDYHGHDKGVAFRFLYHPVKNEMLSQESGDIEINDDIELIEWTKDKNNKIVERVHMIGDALLKFRKKKVERIVTDEAGRTHRHVEMQTVFPLECVGGLYKEEYERWRKGLHFEGLELSRWNRLTLGEVKTLQSEGIFTVEQMASIHPDRAKQFPKNFQEKFKEAIQFCNAQKPMADLKELSQKLVESNAEKLALRRDHEALLKRIAKLEANAHGKKVSFTDSFTDITPADEEDAPVKAAPKKRGRPKKVKKPEVKKPKYVAPVFEAAEDEGLDSDVEFDEIDFDEDE